MPNSRLDRARGTLPEGYQFGDGAIALTSGERVFLSAVFSAIDRGIAAGPIIAPEWRRPSDNAAARLTSAAYRITQAQIAADLHAGEQ